MNELISSNNQYYSRESIVGGIVGEAAGNYFNNSLSSSSNQSNQQSSQSNMASGDFSSAAVSGAKNAISQNIPQDGMYGEIANSALNNMNVGSDGISFNYEGMASDMLSSNKYTKGIADAMNSPVGQCAIGAAKVYAGFQTGNPQMMLEGAKQIYDNYEGAIDQIENSPIGKAAKDFCDDLKKLGEGCKNCCNDIKNELKKIENNGEPGKNKDEGGCSGNSSESDSSCDDNKADEPKIKEEIDDNQVPENWWDKLPDFDPRVYDAILMEQASACVDYIFKGLPDMYEFEHELEARKFRKICPRLKTQVPRTKVIKPTEIVYDTKIG